MTGERAHKANASFGKVDLQSVVSETDVGRQSAFGAVRQFVTDVGEKSPRRPHPLSDFERLVNTQVSRMRPVPQGIDNKQLCAFDLARNVVRHRAAIAQVGEELAVVADKEITVDFGRFRAAPAME